MTTFTAFLISMGSLIAYFFITRAIYLIAAGIYTGRSLEKELEKNWEREDSYIFPWIFPGMGEFVVLAILPVITVAKGGYYLLNAIIEKGIEFKNRAFEFRTERQLKKLRSAKQILKPCIVDSK